VIPNDFTALMVLAMLGLVLGFGFIILGLLLAVHRRLRRTREKLFPVQNFFPVAEPPARPVCWLAIRSASPEAVKDALGLNRAEPCSWTEGLTGA
jgi:hypothetical protein